MISFIVPAYNAGQTIRYCLKSILEQTVQNFEVIVVDNNSTDSTVEIVNEYSIQLLHENKQGRSHARNCGARVAKGKYLAFIDADVILTNNWAENALKSFSIPSVGGIAGPVIPSELMGKPGLNSFRRRAGKDSTDGEFNLLNLTVKESPMINSAACMYLKSAFEKAGGFDVGLERHEDIDLSKRVMLAGFDLASVPDARAEVIFNGDGWISYLKRTFDDGYTKQDYLQKWQNYLFENPDAQKSRLGMFMDEVILNLLTGVSKQDPYFFLRSVNSAVKTSGQLSKIFTFRSIKKYHYDMIREKAYVFENGQPIIEFDMVNKTVNKMRKEN